MAVCCAVVDAMQKNDCTIIAQVSNYAYVCVQLPWCIMYDDVIQYILLVFITLPLLFVQKTRSLYLEITRFIVYLSVHRVAIFFFFVF